MDGKRTRVPGTERGLEQIGCRHAFKERLLCQPQSKSAFTGRCAATAGLLTGPKVDRL